MQTTNDLRVVFCYEDLKKLIQEQVALFRKELTIYMGEDNKEKHLDTKPLNIQQVADRYGVSKATVHNWMKQEIIKGFKQGKGRYFYLHELDQSLTRYKYFEMLQNTGVVPQNKNHFEYRKEMQE